MDLETVRRAQQGDQAAFATLATAMAGRFHEVAYRILREAAAAQDATQQAVTDVWRHLPQLRDPARFEAWSYRVLVRACHAEARRARSLVTEVLPDGSWGPPTPDATAQVADREQLERGFRRLPVDQRAVVVLRYYLDLEPLEIARLLDIPAGTVHSRLSRAMATLRAALDADSRPGAPAALSRELTR